VRFRYPEREFDADDEEFSCPVCEGFCNCTHCCRKRGEAYVYVGMRTCDKFTPAPQRPRVKLGAKTNLPPPPSSSLLSRTTIKTTTMPEGATNARGSLYSVTGEKIGTFFFDPSAAEKDNSSNVFAPSDISMVANLDLRVDGREQFEPNPAEVVLEKGSSIVEHNSSRKCKRKMIDRGLGGDNSAHVPAAGDGEFKKRNRITMVEEEDYSDIEYVGTWPGPGRPQAGKRKVKTSA
jgi:hypothetical protein